MSNEPRANLHSITVRIKDEDYMKLVKTAKGMSMSDLLRQIIHGAVGGVYLDESDEDAMKKHREKVLERRMASRKAKSRGLISRLFGR